MPDSLVFCCSDGRFHPQVEDFIHARVSERPDFIALPGGPVGLDAWASSFDNARVCEEALRFLIEHHGIRSVWLIAHSGCGFYRHKHPGSSDEELRERQLRDLRSGRERLLQMAPSVSVHLVYASVKGPTVEFSEVPVPGTGGRR